MADVPARGTVIDVAVLEPDREQWQQLKAVLTTVLKVTASGRPAVLRQMLAHDPALLECALDMLQYYDTATRRFDLDAGGSVGRGSRAMGAAAGADGGLPVGPGDIVGAYRVLRKLGEGGMGVVFLAEDQRLGRQVALKFLSRAAPAMLADPRAQLLSESRSAALLNHAAIVTLHDVFEHEGELVTVMEYVEGRPLDELIAGEPLPLGFALRLTSQLADALAYAHGRGIVHCDLKPENVHVLPNGSPKILDFGLARVLAEVESGADGEKLFGTPGYLAPERLLGREASAAADVYALGVIFYQLLTGTMPFAGGDERQLFLDTIATPPQPPSVVTRGVPPAVDELVLRCLAKSPRERLQPHELVRAITGVLLELETSPIAGDTRASGTHDDIRRSGAHLPVGIGDGRARRRTVATAAGIVAAVAVGSGLLTTWTFNQVVERPAGFDAESLVGRSIVGLRSMVYPGVVMSMGIAAAAMVRLAARPLLARAGVRADRPVVSPAVALVLFALLAAAAIAILLVGFSDVTNALVAKLGSAPPETLAALGPDRIADQAQYRTIAALCLVALVIAWRPLLAADADGRKLPLEIRGGALGVIVLLAVLAQAPYKLTVYNEVPVALVGGLRCYVLGERGGDVRAFCPQWDVPRVRTISRATAGVEPCGFEENLFVRAGGRSCQVTR